MKLKKTILLLLLMVLFISCSKDKEEKKIITRLNKVETTNVEFGTIQNTISATGNIEGTKEAKISSKIPGKINTIYVDEGDYVENNQILIKLDQTEALINKRRAESALATAEASYKNALVGFEDAERTYNRMKQLYNNKSVSEQQYQKAETGYKMARANVELSKSTKNQAEVGLELAAEQFNNTLIKAPFTGYITHVFINESEITNPGIPLLKLANYNNVEITTSLPEEYYVDIITGLKTEITVPAFRNKIFYGNIIKKEPTIDPRNRKFNITILIKNVELLLRPGMYSTVKIYLKSKDNILKIPNNAIKDDINKSYVFIYSDTSQKVYKTYIKTGISDDDYTEIISGLTKDNKIVSKGLFGLENDMTVQVIK